MWSSGKLPYLFIYPSIQSFIHVNFFYFSLKEKSSETSLFLECDTTVKDAILKHLKVYKIRRKVSVAPCPELAVWALLPVDRDSSSGQPEVTANKEDIVLERDPRTELMGWRLIANQEVNPKDIISSTQAGDPEDYHRHRYKIGMFLRFCCTFLFLSCTQIFFIQQQ